jgi:hypothetical protein
LYENKDRKGFSEYLCGGKFLITVNEEIRRILVLFDCGKYLENQ